MRRFLLLLLLFLALTLLAFFCIRHHAPAIEADLQVRSTAALSAAAITGARATVDGRDVLLEGTVASEELKKQAEKEIRAIEGTAQITNRLRIGAGSVTGGSSSAS